MADLIPNQPWQSDYIKAQRNRKLAEALMQNAMTPTQGGMVGRYYVGPGIGDGLAKLGQALLARNLDNGADTAEQNALSAQQAQKQKALGDFTSAITPKEETITTPTGLDNFVEASRTTRTIKPTPQQIGTAILNAKAAGLDVSPEMVKLLNPEPVKVGQGESILDPSTFKPMFNNPKVPEGMMVNPDGSFAWMPNYIGGKVQIAQAGRPTTNVNVSNAKYGNKFSETSGEDDAKFLGGLRDSARNAANTITTLTQLEKLGDNAFAGPGANALLTTEKMLSQIGIPMSQDAIASENFKQIAGDLILSKVKALGANPTDTDRQFIFDLMPQLGTSRDARVKLLKFLKDKAAGVINDYKSATDYAKKNGNLSGYVGAGYEPGSGTGNDFDM